MGASGKRGRSVTSTTMMQRHRVLISPETGTGGRINNKEPSSGSGGSDAWCPVITLPTTLSSTHTHTNGSIMWTAVCSSLSPLAAASSALWWVERSAEHYGDMFMVAVSSRGH